MELKLNRPLVIFDIESTGIQISKDRIIEIYLIKILPDGTEKHKHEILNPGIPIPAEASAIHGFYDEDVKDKPFFKDKANELKQFIDNCDFGGFNSNKFDFPLLVEEFHRAEIEFDIEKRKFVDVMKIFHTMEPRNLAAAYQFYCGKTLENAHSAEADTIATFEILKSQLNKYNQIEKTIDALHSISGQSNLVDLAGRIVLEKGIEIYNFGKHKGKAVKDVFRLDPHYYDWIQKNDFAENTKQVLTRLKLKYK